MPTDDATYSFFGVDEKGVIQHGPVMSGTIRAFTKRKFKEGWTTLDVMNNAGVLVAGIIQTSKGWGTKDLKMQWWSDVA